MDNHHNFRIQKWGIIRYRIQYMPNINDVKFKRPGGTVLARYIKFFNDLPPTKKPPSSRGPIAPKANGGASFKSQITNYNGIYSPP